MMGQIDVQKLHEQLINMSLGDLLLLAGQAANLPVGKEKLDIILRYVEIALTKRKLNKP